MKTFASLSLLASLALTGCAADDTVTPDPHANETCVKSHTVDNSFMMPVVIDANGTTTYMWVYDLETVCDKWETSK